MKPTLVLTDDEKAEDTIAYLMAENEQQAAEIERLREALRPFADAWTINTPSSRVGPEHFEQAARALEVTDE